MANLINVKVIAFDGAKIEFVNRQDGSVNEITLDGGIHDLTPYHAMLEAHTVELHGVWIVSSTNGRLRDFRNPAHLQTAAEQNFVPSSERIVQRQIEQMAMRIVSETRRKETKRAEHMKKRQELREEQRAEKRPSVGKAAGAKKAASKEDQTGEVIDDEATAQNPE